MTQAVDLLIRAPRAVTGECYVDLAFWAGVIPGNMPDLEPLARAGVAGFKCFLADSGSPDFPPVDPGQLTEALRVAARLGLPLLVHAESAPTSAPATPDYAGSGSAGSPPIREAANRELLWRGLTEGQVDQIVSDHSPCTPPMKAAGDWNRAWGGISSLQLGLSLVWTQARRRGIGLAQVAAWMAAAPARLVGLTAKGRIAPGYDADLCVLTPEQSFVVDPARLHHKHPATTPYHGRTLHGVVQATILRGQLIDPGQPRGKLLTREPK
jgi:allantoinase